MFPFICCKCSYHFHFSKGQEEEEAWWYILASLFKLARSATMGTVTSILVFSSQGERDKNCMCFYWSSPFNPTVIEPIVLPPPCSVYLLANRKPLKALELEWLSVCKPLVWQKSALLAPIFWDSRWDVKCKKIKLRKLFPNKCDFQSFYYGRL